MKFTTISTTIAIILASLTSASPAEVKTRELVTRATSASISDYAISCTDTSFSYKATAQLLPENVIVTFNATSSGPTITSSGIIFKSSNSLASLALSRPLSQYRLVLVYLPDGAGNPPNTFQNIWKANTPDYTNTSYVGLPSFPLTLFS